MNGNNATGPGATINSLTTSTMAGAGGLPSVGTTAGGGGGSFLGNITGLGSSTKSNSFNLGKNERSGGALDNNADYYDDEDEDDDDDEDEDDDEEDDDEPEHTNTADHLLEHSYDHNHIVRLEDYTRNNNKLAPHTNAGAFNELLSNNKKKFAELSRNIQSSKCVKFGGGGGGSGGSSGSSNGSKANNANRQQISTYEAVTKINSPIHTSGQFNLETSLLNKKKSPTNHPDDSGRNWSLQMGKSGHTSSTLVTGASQYGTNQTNPTYMSAACDLLDYNEEKVTVL